MPRCLRASCSSLPSRRISMLSRMFDSIGVDPLLSTPCPATRHPVSSHHPAALLRHCLGRCRYPTHIGLVELYQPLSHELWCHTCVRCVAIHNIVQSLILVHKICPR